MDALIQKAIVAVCPQLGIARGRDVVFIVIKLAKQIVALVGADDLVNNVTALNEPLCTAWRTDSRNAVLCFQLPRIN